VLLCFSYFGLVCLFSVSLFIFCVFGVFFLVYEVVGTSASGLLCVEQDIKLYSLTHSLAVMLLQGWIQTCFTCTYLWTLIFAVNMYYMSYDPDIPRRYVS